MILGEPVEDFNTSAPKTGFFKAQRMALVRGVLDIEHAGLATLSGLQSYLNPEGGEKTYNYIQESLEPRRKSWTPDPAGVSDAARLVSGIVGMVPAIAATAIAPEIGLPLMVGQATMNTGTDLIDQGVDVDTAKVMAALSGLTTYGMMKLPFDLKGIKKKAAAVAAQPVAGGLATEAEKRILEAGDYPEIAKNYDPLDPVARGVDLVMGGVFATLGHLHEKALEKNFKAEKQAALDFIENRIKDRPYNEQLNSLPAEVADSLSILRDYQKSLKDMPFDPKKPGAIQTHLEALGKAMDDLVSDRPVDVAEQIRSVDGMREPRNKEGRKIVAKEVTESIKDLKAEMKANDIPTEVTVKEDWGSGETISKQGTIIANAVRDRQADARAAKSRSKNEKSYLNDPVEYEVERTFAEKGDIPGGEKTGVDKQGNPEFSGMKKVIDDAKVQVDRIRDTEELRRRMSYCIKKGA